MPDSERTLGEAFRELARLEQSCERRADAHVHRDTYEAHREADRRRITALEERMTWAWRAAITGIVLPIVVGLVLAVLLYGRAG